MNLTAQTLERKKYFTLDLKVMQYRTLYAQEVVISNSNAIKKDDAQFITEILKKSELKDHVDVIQKKQRIIIFSIPQQITEPYTKKISNKSEIQFKKKIDVRDSYHQTLEIDMP